MNPVNIDVFNLIVGDAVILGVGLVVGFIFGKIGFSTVESDISTIKGLISGQQKVTVVTTPAQTPVVATVPATNPVQA